MAGDPPAEQLDQSLGEIGSQSKLIDLFPRTVSLKNTLLEARKLLFLESALELFSSFCQYDSILPTELFDLKV